MTKRGVRLHFSVAALFTFAACSGTTEPSDTGPADTGSAVDLGTVDTGVVDTGADAGSVDLGPPDTGIAPAFSVNVFDNARIGSKPDQPNFHVVTGTIAFGEGPFASVIMTVGLDTTCFPFSKWQSNPPPPGENWPANCDAFDRNFEVTIDHPDEAGDPPAVELVRAITPFGGPMQFQIDVTDFANGRPGTHDVHMRITTWSDGAGQVSGSDGGWNVSLDFDVTPGPAPRNVIGVLPLVNGNHRTDTTTTSFAFDTPAGTTSARLEYRVTGHGGGTPGRACIGPAEEFCRRFHKLSLDGTQLANEDAWRRDCATLCTRTREGTGNPGFEYCAENPTGAIRSVEAPRANWCPGDVTPPFNQEWPELAVPGPHEFSYEIRSDINNMPEFVLPGGSVRMSAVVYFFGD